jgi:hypothetical protein
MPASVGEWPVTPALKLKTDSENGSDSAKKMTAEPVCWD